MDMKEKVSFAGLILAGSILTAFGGTYLDLAVKTEQSIYNFPAIFGIILGIILILSGFIYALEISVNEY